MHGSRNNGDLVDKLLDTNIRAGGMACLWCIRSQLSKRMYAAFNKWRLHALLIRLSNGENKHPYHHDEHKPPIVQQSHSDIGSIDNRSVNSNNQTITRPSKGNISNNNNISQPDTLGGASPFQPVAESNSTQSALQKMHESLDPEERRKMLRKPRSKLIFILLSFPHSFTVQLSFGIIDRGKSDTAKERQPPPTSADTHHRAVADQHSQSSHSHGNDPGNRQRSFSGSTSIDEHSASTDRLRHRPPFLASESERRSHDSLASSVGGGASLFGGGLEDLHGPAGVRPLHSEEYLSIDPTLFINLKRPSSRGSNLDLLAGNAAANANGMNMNMNSTSRSRSGSTHATRLSAAPPREEEPLSLHNASFESFQKRDSFLPDGDAGDGGGASYSAGFADGEVSSLTSRSQTLSNLTYTTFASSSAKTSNPNPNPNPASRRLSPPRARDFSLWGDLSRPSTHSRSSYPPPSFSSTTSSSSAHPTGRNSLDGAAGKLPITFKKSHEGDYVQELLSPKSKSRLKAAQAADPLLSRHSNMRFSLSSNPIHSFTPGGGGGVAVGRNTSFLSEAPRGRSTERYPSRTSRDGSGLGGSGLAEGSVPRYLLSTSSFQKKAVERDKRGSSPSPFVKPVSSSYSSSSSSSSRPTRSRRTSSSGPPSHRPDHSYLHQHNAHPLPPQPQPQPQPQHSYGSYPDEDYSSLYREVDEDGHAAAHYHAPEGGDWPEAQEYVAPVESHSYAQLPSRSSGSGNGMGNGIVSGRKATSLSPSAGRGRGNGNGQYHPDTSSLYNDTSYVSALPQNETVVRGRPRHASATPSSSSSSVARSGSRSRGGRRGMERAQMQLLYGDLGDSSELRKRWMTSLRG